MGGESVRQIERNALAQILPSIKRELTGLIFGCRESTSEMRPAGFAGSESMRTPLIH
jgi:hypothetical protein